MGALKGIPLFTCNKRLRSFFCLSKSSFSSLCRKGTEDLLILSVFPFFTTYFFGFLVFIECRFSFKGNRGEKISCLIDFFANFRAILILLSLKLSIFMKSRASSYPWYLVPIITLMAAFCTLSISLQFDCVRLLCQTVEQYSRLPLT